MSETTSLPYMSSSLLTVTKSTASGMMTVAFGAGGNVTAFSPSQLPGLVGWYDATQITGVSSGGSISAWTDLSGNGNNLLQAVTVAQPTYQTGSLNGLPSVQFDGIDDTLAAASIATFAQPFTLWMVAKHRSTPGSNEFMMCGNVFAGILKTATPKFGISDGATLLSASADTAFHLIVGVFSGSSSTIAIDGTETNGNAGTNDIGKPLNFAADHAGGECADMNLCEGGIASAGWNASQRAALLAYSRSKWGTP